MPSPRQSHSLLDHGLARQDISAPPFGRHRLGTGTSRSWDISAPAVMAPDDSALVLYVAAAAALHSDSNNTLGTYISIFLYAADIGA